MRKEDRKMKRIVALLTVCCLLFAAAPALSWEEPPKPFIYRGAISFGMTMDEVKEKAEGLLSSPSITLTEGNFQFLTFTDSSPNAAVFCFNGTEDTAGLIEIYCTIYNIVGMASGAESSSIDRIDFDPAVAYEDYCWLENALTEKYGKPEPSSETLSVYIKAYNQGFGEEAGTTLENIMYRVLPQADGSRVVIEHSLVREVSTGIIMNLVGYYFLDPWAYLDYLNQQYPRYRQYEDDIHSFLTEVL